MRKRKEGRQAGEKGTVDGRGKEGKREKEKERERETRPVVSCPGIPLSASLQPSHFG